MEVKGKIILRFICPPLVLTEEEIQANKLMREHTYDFIQLYLRTHNHEPNDTKVRTHLELWYRPHVVSWVTPNERSKVDHLARKGITLMELADMVKYNWVDVEVLGTLLVMKTK